MVSLVCKKTIYPKQFQLLNVFLFSFNGDKIYTFRGERTEDDILAFVNKAKG